VAVSINVGASAGQVADANQQIQQAIDSPSSADNLSLVCRTVGIAGSPVGHLRIFLQVSRSSALVQAGLTHAVEIRRQ
jgi:hypothetical protein